MSSLTHRHHHEPRHAESTRPAAEEDTEPPVAIHNEVRSDGFSHEEKVKFLRILQAVVFIDLLGVALVLPIMYQYAMAHNVGATEYGWLGTIYSAAQLAGSPVMLWVMNRYGRKTALLVNFVGAAGSYLGAAFAPSFLFLCAMRVPVGLVKKTMMIGSAYAAQLTEVGTRSIALGQMRSAVSLAFVVGPAVGGYLASYDLKLPAIVSAFLFAVDFVVVYVFLPHIPSDAPSASSAAAPTGGGQTGAVALLKKVLGGAPDADSEADYGVIRAVLLTGVLLEVGERLNRGSLSVILTELGLGMTGSGLVWSFNAGVSTFMGTIGIRLLSKKLGDHKTARDSIVACTVVLLLWCAFPSFYMFVFTFTGYIAASFSAETCLTSILTHEIEQVQVASALTAVETVNSLIGVVAPLLSGYLSSVSIYAPAMAAVLFCAVARISARGLPYRHVKSS